MVMIIIVAILVAVIVALTAVLLVLFYRRWNKNMYVENEGKKIIVNKHGADVESGNLGSGSLFYGFSQNEMGTICIGENSLQENTRRVKIIRLTDRKSNTFLERKVSGRIYVGRHPQQNMPGESLVIPHSSISALHCCIYLRENHIYVEDKQSTNGTFINGNRIKSPQPLSDGDVLRMGQNEFVVRII